MAFEADAAGRAMGVLAQDLTAMSSALFPAPGTTAPEFPTVFGRELVGELPNFAYRPYLVVTMSDLWPAFEHFFDSHLAAWGAGRRSTSPSSSRGAGGCRCSRSRPQ